MLSVLFGNNIYQQPQTKLVALNKHPYTTYEWIKKTVDFVSNRCGAQHFVYKRKTCTIYWIGIGHFVGKRTSCTLYSQRDSANLEFNNHKTHTHTHNHLSYAVSVGIQINGKLQYSPIMILHVWIFAFANFILCTFVVVCQLHPFRSSVWRSKMSFLAFFALWMWLI